MTADSRSHQNQRIWSQSGIVPVIRFEKRMYNVLPRSAIGCGKRGLSMSARKPSA